MTEIRDFQPVRRDRSSVLIGLAGGSSSGKTMSGLLLADGISGDTPFAMLDTEGRRGQHYGEHVPRPVRAPATWSRHTTRIA